MNKQYKYLFKNVGLLTLSSFASKLLSFFLVPLYTNVLTTAEYGINDLFYTTIGVLIPIITLNIQESVLRFALDKKYKEDVIVTVAVKYIIVSSLITSAGLWINHILGFSLVVKEYSVFFFFLFFTQMLAGILTAYIRGVDKIKELSISSLLASFMIIVCNLLFLLVFHWGLNGYFLANIIGPLVQCGYLIVKADCFSKIRWMQAYPNENREMVTYCRPLIANSLAWWVNGVSDRYLVLLFCGLAENGIYSVASKIPTILNVFQTIFNQAWTLSAVKDFDEHDSGGFFGNTYMAYNCAMTLLCSMVIVGDKILARILYAKDFYIAWKYVPWLTISILFGALSGFLGGIFSAVKNSKIFAQSTLAGAVINVLLNLILIPNMGALGAAIATMISYIVVWGTRLWHSRKYVQFRIRLKRDVISYLVLIIQAVVLLFFDGISMYMTELALLFGIVLMYHMDIRFLVSQVRKKKE